MPVLRPFMRRLREAAIVLACGCATLSATAADIVPYLQTPTASSIWVSWKTAAGDGAVVEYGIDGGPLDRTATGSTQALAASYRYHGVQLTGLQPDTFYSYRVRTGDQVSPVYRFRTQPTAARKTGVFRILVTGDHQLRNDDRHTPLLKAAKAKIESLTGQPLEEAVNLMLNNGDQVDVGTLDHYEFVHMKPSAVVSGNLAIMTALGNHETYYDTGLTNWRAHNFYSGISYKGIAAAADETYYAHQVGRVLLVYLNSESSFAAQTEWLRKVVAAADADADVDWVISVVHRPYQAEQYVGDISQWFRDTAMPILAGTRKHALNIGAHHHLYARGQTRDWPVYHIISGGTAWDQFWGQSTERDMDDVQKTIANWTWQLIEFDLAARTMKVSSYAEGHPKLGFAYESRLVDEFERRLDAAGPLQPALSGVANGSVVTLPQSFTLTPFQSPSGMVLNSTQFQIARDVAFTTNVVDLIRDVENVYGDTGAPAYEPVDLHAGVDIQTYTVQQYALNNGSYYIRARHRDANAEWSAWSEPQRFTVEGSSEGDPALVLAKKVYAASEPVVIDYRNSRKATDWVGIYRKGQTPGAATPSLKWSYVSGTSGQLAFSGLTQGVEYYAAFLSEDSYVEMAPRVAFYVGSAPELAINKTQFNAGERPTFTWSGAPGGSKDWIGVYRVGHTPGAVNSTVWAYAPSQSGSVTLDALDKGYYFAAFFVNDEYFEISERIPFAVGTEIASLSLAKTALQSGEKLTISFADGPGTAKDYVGVFRKGATPGIDLLVDYYYVDGRASGTLTPAQALPDGEYFLALYINDSYTEVSNRVSFTVGAATEPEPEPRVLGVKRSVIRTGDALEVSWSGMPGQAKDWVAVYRATQTPGGAGPSVLWRYAPAPSGSATFSGLDAGEYYVAFLLNDGYEEAATRVPFSVRKRGDIDGNGLINLADRDAQRAALGSCQGDARYQPLANFDADNCITQADYKLWYAIFSRQ
ncbi:MAG: fibronectin type III domain-containing protein [Pseudomonadota bacterium]